MIHTSALYNTLLEEGAIQEYKIVIDGVEYIDDAIYDNVKLKQQLFSADTFSIGGFALAKLDVKLRVPTLNIPRNANIKFYYRLTNMNEHSEWVQKFNGRITKRRRYTDDVTTIEAVSNGANYDKFLDVFQEEVIEYPANNRSVVSLCSNYLGLIVDNIDDVYDGNNVEYPNELTIIEVLQNIAAFSGGNWIITEDDKLRLVISVDKEPINMLEEKDVEVNVGVLSVSRNLKQPIKGVIEVTMDNIEILENPSDYGYTYIKFFSTTDLTAMKFLNIDLNNIEPKIIDLGDKEYDSVEFTSGEDGDSYSMYNHYIYKNVFIGEYKEVKELSTYSAFNIVSEEPIPPISRVTMYYQDDKAFTAGDDTGSELTIDCAWATQETTDYVLSLYKGYVYKPIQGVGVAIDGAIQLGDSFLYEDGQTQLAAAIEYIFDGSLSANVNAPSNNEVDYDDPYQTITNAPFKRKVTLGDHYQGVSISRDKGIEMLYSPDGSEEHASGKFYADLSKGMAFQYKNEETGIWEDWLYFDKNENIFKLMLKGGDLDEQMVNIVIELNRIIQEIENIHNGNLIYNLNGNNDLVGWEGMAELTGIAYSENLTYRDVDTYFDGTGEKEGLRYPDGLFEFDGLTYGMNAMPVEIPNSLSGIGLSFFGKSEMRSPFAVLAVNGKYSFRAKVIDFKETIIKIYEYSQVPSDGIQHDYVTRFEFKEKEEFIEITLTPQTSTKYIRIGITVPDANIDEHTKFTEMMFNYGMPQTWFQSADDAMAYAKSSIAQLANKIELQAEELDLISGDLHNAGVEINARDGVTTRGSKFRVMSSDGNETYMEVNERGLFVKDATIEGNLTAGTIAGLLFEGSKIKFPDGNLSLDSSKNSIMFGTTQMKFEQSSYNYGEETFYSDDVVIQMSNGKVRIGEGVSPVAPELTSQITGIDIIQTKVIYHQDGVLLGSLHSGSIPNYFSGDFIPYTNNIFNIGNTSRRVKTIYLGSQPNVSSDSRLKRNILPIDNKLIEIFAKEVKPKTYTMVNNDEIHFGYIAQDIERALYKYNLSKYGLNKAKIEVNKFAMLCKDESYMSLLYGEIAVMMDAYNRKKIDEFEDRITKLERMILDGNN